MPYEAPSSAYAAVNHGIIQIWRSNVQVRPSDFSILIVAFLVAGLPCSMALVGPTAVCADGSPAWFHMATNASSSDYVFYLQGGAVSCAHNQALCTEEAATTSLALSERAVLDAAGLLSGDPPHLYSTSNRVLIPYCSMDMFLLDTQSADGELQFRGRSLLE